MATTPTSEQGMTGEASRLEEAREKSVPWRQWGPYLSERQWGTVREDYSEDGNAWDYFSHDQARSRAYHWGEDGLAGISDDKQRLCFALALWNGKDPILKERVYGLTNSEANHGEDVKEYYFYLDSTPTHSYMKYLYKYPQNEFPYLNLIQSNRGRSKTDPEYELLDTGIFNEDRYFDVFVEYAKATPTDLLVEISIANRGPAESEIHVLPTLWFRNFWTWWPQETKPSLRDASQRGGAAIAASDAVLGDYFLHCEGRPILLFTENETNNERLFGTANPTPYVKDGINDCVVADRQNAINPNNTGTKAAANYQLRVGAGATAVVRIRLSNAEPGTGQPFGAGFAQILEARRREADEFYRSITPAGVGEDAANVMRQALAGMLWSKQYFFYDVNKWLLEHGVDGRAGGSAITSGFTWSAAMSSRCRTSGSIPGSRLGTWRFTRSRSPPSTPISPSSSSTCCLSGFSCIRAARSRPMSGTSATSIRRCMAGPRFFSTGPSRRCGARPMSIS
jgi:hypothetical protein